MIDFLISSPPSATPSANNAITFSSLSALQTSLENLTPL